MRCSLLTNQGPGASSTHAAQHCGRGADLWRYQVRPDSDTAVSQLLRGHHEQLLCWGGRPSAQWWRSFAVLRWKQLHYIHEGRGWQVRGIKGLKLSLPKDNEITHFYTTNSLHGKYLDSVNNFTEINFALKVFWFWLNYWSICFSPSGIALQLGTRPAFLKRRMILRCCALLQQERLSSTRSRMAVTCFLASAMLK